MESSERASKRAAVELERAMEKETRSFVGYSAHVSIGIAELLHIVPYWLGCSLPSPLQLPTRFSCNNAVRRKMRFLNSRFALACLPALLPGQPTPLVCT